MTESTATVPALVSARGLGRRFGATVAVAQIALEVFPGEIFGVVGADGSGKTTLLQMLAAILDPTEGSCQVLGFDTVRQAAAVTGRIGYMSQGFTLYERLTVAENLDFAARVRNVDAAAFDERQRRLLAMAGLERFVDRRAERLSGGMKKKLALCANLIHQPRVLLLDEPSLGVDPVSRRELWNLLEGYRREGAAIVMATSYMDEADRCDRLLFLHECRVLTLGTPAELKARVRDSVFEIESPDPASIERALTMQPEVGAFARLPGRVRFYWRAAPTIDVPSFPPALANARRADPRLEDVFAATAPLNPPPTRGAISVTPPSLGAQPVPARIPEVTVRARSLTCRFGDFTAVNDVTLELAAGEVFGFLGPNGAGKTTLIRILCGLQRYQSGDVEVAGLSVPRDARALRRRIGYMSQRFSLYPELTVMENIEFFAGVYGLRNRSRTEAVEWVVDTAGLQGLDSRRVSAVSGAVRQRLALACSVIHRPRVLFLDEPTSGVDPLSRHRFWRLVHDLAENGVTAFVTTHYLEEAAYCHRLGLMFQGRLIGLGTLATLSRDLGLAPSIGVEDLFLRAIARAQVAA